MPGLLDDLIADWSKDEMVVGVLMFGGYVKRGGMDSRDLDLLVVGKNTTWSTKKTQQRGVTLHLNNWPIEILIRFCRGEVGETLSDTFLFEVFRSGRILHDPEGRMLEFQAYARTHRIPETHILSLARRAWKSLSVAQDKIEVGELEGAELEVRNAAEQIAMRLLLEKDIAEIYPPRNYQALAELLESLQEEGEVWRKMRALRGREETHTQNLISRDRVHKKEDAGSWVFFAFDGVRMIGHINGMAWDRGPPEYREHTERMKAKYDLVGKRVGHVGVAVHKDYRPRGIGEELMKKAMREARLLGVEVLTNSINTENTPMIHLAEELGFKEHMREKKGENDSILMTLDLSDLSSPRAC